MTNYARSPSGHGESPEPLVTIGLDAFAGSVAGALKCEIIDHNNKKHKHIIAGTEIAPDPT